MAMDKDGTVVVADAGNLSIRKVTPQGVVSTLPTVLPSGAEFFRRSDN
jgi:hypothetical protein